MFEAPFLEMFDRCTIRGRMSVFLYMSFNNLNALFIQVHLLEPCLCVVNAHFVVLCCQMGCREMAQDCVMMFMDGKPPVDQFLCRAYLCQGQLVSQHNITTEVKSNCVLGSVTSRHGITAMICYYNE